MPLHDWADVDAEFFHHFHHQWIGTLSNALNSGSLPDGYIARIEHPPHDRRTTGPRRHRSRQTPYSADKASRVAVTDCHGAVVAVIEVVAPKHKRGRKPLRAFVEQCVELIDQHIHLLLIDIIPPSPRNPRGTHHAIWEAFVEETVELPSDKPLTLASYDAGSEQVAYVEPVAVGDVLPEMPLFLKPGYAISTPLELTYQTTWELFPAPFKRILQHRRATSVSGI